MIEGPIHQDQVFEHEENHHEYIVINGSDEEQKVKMQLPDGTWMDAIAYYDPYQSGILFVRSEESFRRRFKPV